MLTLNWQLILLLVNSASPARIRAGGGIQNHHSVLTCTDCIKQAPERGSKQGFSPRY